LPRAELLAVALARGAAKLGIFPKRFRRPHFQSRDADWTVGALDADRDDHDRLVHFRIRSLGHRIDRRARPLARRTDPALVLRLCRTARALCAAYARPLQKVVGGAL